MRLRKITDQAILDLHHQGKNQSEIALALGVSHVAIHKRLKRLLRPALEKLTPKQRSFCVAVVEGQSRIAAAQQAFDVSSREGAKAIQNTLMEKPQIREAITELMDKQGLTRARRVEVLAAHVENVQDPQTSLKALDMSFKLGNDYPPTKTISLNLTADLGSVDYREFMREYELPAEDEDNTQE